MKLKNIFYALSLVFAMGTFTACDDDETNIPLVDNPGQAASGVYSGTWTLVYDDDAPVTAVGTVTISEGSGPYYANMALACDDASWNMTGDGWSSAMNISQADYGFVFLNMGGSSVGANDLGCAFSGRISPVEGGDEMILDFTKTVKQGRVTHTYVYHFTGVRGE